MTKEHREFRKAMRKAGNYILGSQPIMKNIIAIILLAALPAIAAPPLGYADRMSDKIFIAEGGAKTRYPYGVKSIKPPASVKTQAQRRQWARRITINSINNNWKRWELSGKPGRFEHFMADRWCPASSDPQGNRNWKKNVVM